MECRCGTTNSPLKSSIFESIVDSSKTHVSTMSEKLFVQRSHDSEVVVIGYFIEQPIGLEMTRLYMI